jgi:hypothetical protein
MNPRTFGFLKASVVLLLLFSPMIHRANAQVGTPQPDWKDTDPNHTNVNYDGQYSLDSFGGHCAVRVLPKGQGMLITAIDRHYIDPRDGQKWELWETIRISSDSLSPNISYGESRPASERRITSANSYDIFKEHFLKTTTARTNHVIPEDIKQLIKQAYAGVSQQARVR